MQVDLDLGNYERFLDITLTRDNNVTTGKVYQVKSSCAAAQHRHRHRRRWLYWYEKEFLYGLKQLAADFAHLSALTGSD